MLALACCVQELSRMSVDLQLVKDDLAVVAVSLVFYQPHCTTVPLCYQTFYIYYNVSALTVT